MRSGLEHGVYFRASRSEIGGNKGHNNKDETGEGELVVVMVVENADGYVEQNSHHDTHNQTLQHLVSGDEVDVAQGNRRKDFQKP